MSLSSFLFFNPSDQPFLMYGVYDTGRIALSFLIAVFTATLALQIAGLGRLAKTPWQRQYCPSYWIFRLAGLTMRTPKSPVRITWPDGPTHVCRMRLCAD